MSAGRNRWIAVWAFAALMAFPCGEAVAASVTVPAGSPIPGVSTPALTTPDIPVLQFAPPSPLPQPAPATVAPTSSPAAAPPASDPASRAEAVRVARIPVEPAAQSYGSGHASAASARQARTDGSRSRGTRGAQRARGSRSGTSREALPTFGQSKLDRLGRIVESVAPAPLASDFPGGTSTAAMSWAVPLLAIMLPIGLCGLLQLGRRPREVDG
jgi:hypothetical protein